MCLFNPWNLYTKTTHHIWIWGFYEEILYINLLTEDKRKRMIIPFKSIKEEDIQILTIEGKKYWSIDHLIDESKWMPVNYK